MDNLSPENRKKNMTRIRSRGNRSTEVRLRSSLVGAGLAGFKMNVATLPGKPDFTFAQQRVAVFVDGCFWHGCPKCYIRPKSNQPYWDKKVTSNKARDRRANSALRKMGWKPVRVWEHSVRHPSRVRRTIAKALAEHPHSLRQE